MAEYWPHSFAYANVWRKTKSFGEKLIACIEYVLLSNLAERTGCSWWIWRLLNKIQVSMTQNHTTQTNHFFSKHIKVFLFLKFSVFCFQVLPNMLSLKGFGFPISCRLTHFQKVKKKIIFNIPLLFQEHRISFPLWRSLSMAFFYKAFKRTFLIIG